MEKISLKEILDKEEEITNRLVREWNPEEFAKAEAVKIIRQYYSKFDN